MQRVVGPFSGSVVVPTRVRSAERLGPTPRQVRGTAWRRTSRGLFVRSETPRTPEQRVVEASMVVPEGGGITGWGALRWAGGRWFEGTARGGRVEVPVTIATCHGDIRPQPGIAICHERLSPADLMVHDGLVLTSLVCATFFEVRYARNLVEAVVAAEMSACSDFVSTDELRRFVESNPRYIGVPQARKVLALMEENSWSPMETRLRVLWVVGAGLPRPLVNRPVFTLDGRHLATPDLLDVDAGLAVEYDGSDHLRQPQRLHDVRRESRVEDAGLHTLSVVTGEMDSPRDLLQRLHSARRRALATPRAQEWTIDKPPWWSSLDTVAERRAARGRQASA